MSVQHTAAAHIHRDDVASRMGMWLFLFTELLLFGGMFILYSVYRFTHPEDFHLAAKELNTVIGTFNTAILLTSSLTMALSIAAIQRKQKTLSIIFQLLTIVLALGFMVNKYFEWGAKFHHGIYPGSETLLSKPSGEILFFGLYYVMTGLHGLHVIIGVVIIAFMTVFTMRDVITHDNYVKLESAGLYWHLVDIIWIFLFPLFYLIT
ncbi:Cytochrome c oxidase subunit III [Ignavibacterium album JCM 16511]|uniref:Cytochrome c oxidase subunit III n=1 Tax=Ignavibacterium album (strain DSM 19864 / JCM 16511 / NBRC 101810 / Mat9-16) TaxID=945713 RepID=I0AJE8_IGNAJ|nr:cytochrome c oxidase subunit 3 family protein [Ignavibacterium album]AFH49105.1 Cytochrome c oxidase subunit III [Ignavibacterium album JCM 16511]